MGRPSKASEWLEPDKLLLLEQWARDGLTDEQIANKIGIARQTLIDWKNKFPDIAYTLKRGKEVIDSEVEKALIKAALGYEYEETVTEINETGGKQKKHIRKMKRYAQPNVTALIFWLKNRKPKNWREKPVEVFADEATETIDELSKSLMQLAEEMESGDNSD